MSMIICRLQDEAHHVCILFLADSVRDTLQITMNSCDRHGGLCTLQQEDLCQPIQCLLWPYLARKANDISCLQASMFHCCW